jgi:toxin ParE1/3/4
MKVHWTESALADLQAIEAYIAGRSARYARGTVERIFARVQQLEAHAMLGPVVPEYGDETLRELLESPYRIVYRVLKMRIDIVAVVHAARHMPGDL